MHSTTSVCFQILAQDGKILFLKMVPLRHVGSSDIIWTVFSDYSPSIFTLHYFAFLLKTKKNLPTLHSKHIILLFFLAQFWKQKLYRTSFINLFCFLFQLFSVFMPEKGRYYFTFQMMSTEGQTSDRFFCFFVFF